MIEKNHNEPNLLSFIIEINYVVLCIYGTVLKKPITDFLISSSSRKLHYKIKFMKIGVQDTFSKKKNLLIRSFYQKDEVRCAT